MTIAAYQKGGRPDDLLAYLPKSSAIDGYSTNCNLKTMYNCILATKGLNDYAHNKFPDQLGPKSY